MKQKIQKSMMLILLVTLFPFYVIMTVILYNQNLGILEKEVQQEAVYLSSGVDVAGEEYLKKLEPMIKADEDTRLTFISQSGDVLYDSDSSKKLENHKSRAEVKQALAEGQGEDIRMSDTVGKELYYCAIRLDDGSVLRLARPMDSLIRTAWNILPVMLVLSVIGIALALFLANWQTKRLMEPVMHLDLEHPLDNVIYPEMVPLLEAIDRQNKEKEAVANMRKEFSANVSHELKTPLTSISGYAEIMMNGLVQPSDMGRFSGKIYQEAQRLITLVGDIIRLSQLDEEKAQLEKQPVDLHMIASDVVKRLQDVAKKNQITLMLTGKPTVVNGNPQILDEMIYNLCDNAIKYNKPFGEVEVNVSMAKEHPVLTVEDDGIGIPVDDQARIFERFYRVDKSHSRQIGGTGLGLSIVKHGAIYHKAKVELKSALGEGTTVRIVF